MANRMIFGAVLTLALSLTPHLAHSKSSLIDEAAPRGLTPGQAGTNGNERYFRNGEGFGPMPIKENISRPDGHLLPAPFGPRPREASLSPSIWESDSLSPLWSRRCNRFEPAKLPDRLLEQAHHYLNTPYRRGSSLQTGRSTDCSGFVQYIYKKANIDLPRASAEQARMGRVAARSMDFSKLLAGDLLFFRDRGRHIGHVGLYMGEGKMIHASSHRRGVTIADLRQGYYQDAFVVAKRLIEEPPGGTPPTKIQARRN